MKPDDLRAAWHDQTHLPPPAQGADHLLRAVRRDAERFDRAILWRDVREIGIAGVMVPVWIALGVVQSLPWTFYLTVPVLIWFVAFLAWQRGRARRLAPRVDDPLRQQLLGSLAQVEHQIQLLRSVPRWALLPFGVAGTIFIGQSAWSERTTGWLWLVAPALALAMIAGVLAVVGWLNLSAVRTELQPRRDDLARLLADLGDETPPSPPPDPGLRPT